MESALHMNGNLIRFLADPFFEVSLTPIIGIFPRRFKIEKSWMASFWAKGLYQSRKLLLIGWRMSSLLRVLCRKPSSFDTGCWFSIFLQKKVEKCQRIFASKTCSGERGPTGPRDTLAEVMSDKGSALFIAKYWWDTSHNSGSVQEKRTWAVQKAH